MRESENGFVLAGITSLAPSSLVPTACSAPVSASIGLGSLVDFRASFTDTLPDRRAGPSHVSHAFRRLRRIVATLLIGAFAGASAFNRIGFARRCVRRLPQRLNACQARIPGNEANRCCSFSRIAKEPGQNPPI